MDHTNVINWEERNPSSRHLTKRKGTDTGGQIPVKRRLVKFEDLTRESGLPSTGGQIPVTRRLVQFEDLSSGSGPFSTGAEKTSPFLNPTILDPAIEVAPLPSEGPYSDRRPFRSGPRERSKRCGQREQKALTSQEIREALATKCCVKECMKKLSFEVIYQLRLSFWGKTQTKQSRFINSHLRAVFKYQEQRLSDVLFTIEGHEVCSVCWCTVFNISKTRFFQHGRAVKDCLPQVVDQRSHQNYDSPKYLEAKVWLDQYFKRHGDHMPHKTEIQLPSCLTKKQIFNAYVEDRNDQGKSAIGYSCFKELWREFFSSVKILKSKDFTQCSLCILYRDALQRKNLGKEEVNTLKEAKQGHLALQRLLREKYYKHGGKAKRSPSKYVSLIIDNMDQNKTNLPVFPEQSKIDGSLAHVKHHVTGVIDHGNRATHAVVWNTCIPGDANVTCTVLLRVLSRIAQFNQGHLPETLYLQADNSPKDNKNKTVLYFLALLVKLKIFKKGKLSFLMVGHTHEDVDQMFSVFARELRQKPAATCDALLQILASSNDPKPTATLLDGVWDMRQLFVSCDSPKGHKEAHVFVFKMDGSAVSMFYKDWPLKSESYRKVPLNFKVDLSTLTPVMLDKEKVDDTCKAMERDLAKWVSSTRLSEEEAMWWVSYIKKIGDIHTLSITLRDFKQFMPAPREQNTLPRKVQEAIERNNEKMQRQSKVSLTKHRRQASAEL